MVANFLLFFLFCMRKTGCHLNGRHDPLDFLKVRKVIIEEREDEKSFGGKWSA